MESILAPKRSFAERCPLFWALVVALYLTSCSTTRPPVTRLYDVGSVSDVEKRLRRNAAQWVGVPYRYGGQGRQGIDCSALVAKLYDATFDVRLPRTVRQQRRMGRPVGVQPLESGDIVFFSTGIRGIHAGIYLGRGEFIHASASRGVTVSNINTRYWRRHYLDARRLMAKD